jgi:glycosyltransferase involved in cell wall biosynthesis
MSIVSPKPLRILFFVPWITKRRNGIPAVGSVVANAMALRGHQVSVLTFENDPAAPPLWSLEAGIRLFRMTEQITDGGDLQMQQYLQVCNADLMVAMHMSKTFTRFVRVARKQQIPIIVSEHMDPVFAFKAKLVTEEDRLVAFSGATRIHLLLNDYINTLPHYMHPRVRIIPNTVEPAHQQAVLNPDGIKTLLAVVSLSARKNVEHLIRVFASIHAQAPDWQLQIVGDGELRSRLEALVTDLGVAHRVIFVGQTNDPYGYYEQAQLFVLPSLIEGFPLCSLEAMSHGLPVVGYRSCTGIRAQLEHGVSGCLSVLDNNRTSLGRDLLTLMHNPALRQRMGEAARIHFEQRFSNQVVFDAWERMCVEAVETFEPVPRPDAAMVHAVKLDQMVFG